MLNLLLAILVVLATVVLLVIIVVLGLWLKGAGNIVFPGLGIVVATGLILAVLIILEAVIVITASYLAGDIVYSWFRIAELKS